VVDELTPSPIREGCPEPETIAAYVDGRLADAEKAEMEAHLASCDDCFTVFSETARSEAELGGGQAPAAVVRGRFGRRWIVLAAAAALAVAASVPILLRSQAHHHVRPELGELVAAVGPQRLFEPRLTGGFEFGPMAPRYRSAKPLSESDSWEVLAAAAKIRKKDEQKSTPATLDALGSANLVLGKYDDAVSNLEEATLEEPKNARYLTDLSAAYLVRAKENDRAVDYPKAIEAAEKATELDPSILEAWFNRALALDELPLKSEAAKAWNDYLKRDPKSPWAQEARRRLSDIQAIPNHAAEWKKVKARMLAAAKVGDERTIRALMPDYCQETREWIEEELLPEWAEAELHDAAKAPDILRESERLAADQSEISADEMLRETTAVIRKAEDMRDAEGLRKLACGHRDYSRARVSYDQGDTDGSRDGFRSAAIELSSARSPYSKWADFYAMVGDFYHAAPPALAERFREEGHYADERRYRLLAARAKWMTGLIDGGNGALVDEIQEYRAALMDLSRCREITGSAAIYGRLSGPFFQLGDGASAWANLRKGFQCLTSTSSKHRWANALGVTAPVLASEGMPRVALHVANTTLDQATSDLERAFLFSTRVSIDLQNDWWKEAAADLNKENLAISNLPDGGERTQLQAFAQARAGALEVSRRPGDAVEALSRSVAYFKTAGVEIEVPQLLLWRGRALLAIGRFDDAERDFVAGLNGIGEARSREREFKVPYVERSWDLISEIVYFQAVQRRRPDLALDYLERERMLDDRGPLTIAAIRQLLSPNTALIYYFIREPELFSWLVTPSAIYSVRQRRSTQEIELLVRSLRSRMPRESSLESFRRASSRLYDLLIRPLAAGIHSDSRLVFIPDGALGNVPFSALWDEASGRYLIEDHVVTTAPNGTTWARASARVNLERGVPETVLAMSNPRAKGPGSEVLPTLFSADREATEIAALYSRSTLFVGNRATKAAFLALAGKMDVIQFSGHAVSNERNPDLSRLYFANESGSLRDSLLFGRDLESRKFSKTRLVTLAACDTAAGIPTHSEGPLSLARPLLSAGIPRVIAALWAADDEGSRQLLVSFHREFARGSSGGTALRTAQLGLLHGPDAAMRSPANWATYELIGGGE
jgi:CHAT domain-containing protein